jgi:hypothetical protein
VSLQSELYIRSTRPPEAENETMSELTDRMLLCQFDGAEFEFETLIEVAVTVVEWCLIDKLSSCDL